MPIVEDPKSLSLFVQWKLHPYESPYNEEQKKKNTEYAVNKTKGILRVIPNFSELLKIIHKHNGIVYLILDEPEHLIEDECVLWKKVFDLLRAEDEVTAIHVYVNNDISEDIALNYADRVSLPWHQGYQGKENKTLIYHK